ncbi:MAG: polysaccharide biosynthesis C-terminal domain-containing protein [Clostridia bacterium]|nr:polysaccharide biosynthesis C-terminal domain-containing protein [Clostridia bacterium]
MSEARRFFKSGILMTAVGLAMRTCAMLFGAFISRTVGAEGTGLYTLVMTVYSFAITFATSGISLTVTRLVASAVGEGRPEGVSRVMGGAFIYSLVFGSLSTLGLFFGADLLGEFILSDPRTSSSLRVLSFSLIPAALSAVFSGYFIGVKRVSFNAVATVFCQLVKMFVTVALVVYLAPFGTVMAVVGLCFGITLTELFGFLLILLEYIYDRRRNGRGIKKQPPELSSVSKTALPLAFSAYVRSLLLNIEHILIPRKLREGGESREEAYANYGTLHGMALPLVTYPMSPLSSFAGLLVPEFAEDMAAKKQGRMSRVASRALNTTLSYALICAVFLFFFAEELGYLVYDSYDAGYYISTLALVVPIMYLDHVTDSILKGIGEQVFSMWVNISDSLLSVILVWLLIPRMGIMGYALVIVIMEGYNFILSFIRLRRKISFKISLAASFVPFVFSLLAVQITKLLFSFGGSTAPALWVVLKLVFALALTVFFLALFKVKEEIKNRKIQTA